jgi:DNA-binding HxlR family transcriptional regulator
MNETNRDDFCPHFHHAIELIGRRWTGVVLRTMLHGATRFSDIAAAVPHMSDKMLAERLKELEAEGVVVRNVLPETPVRVDYALTEKGQSLEPVVAALAEWADAWIGPCPDAHGGSEQRTSNVEQGTANVERGTSNVQRRT